MDSNKPRHGMLLEFSKSRFFTLGDSSGCFFSNLHKNSNLIFYLGQLNRMNFANVSKNRRQRTPNAASLARQQKCLQKNANTVVFFGNDAFTS